MIPEPITPDSSFFRTVESLGPFNTGTCFQCRKCTNGCPVTFAMDLYPDEVVRLVNLGQRETVLTCRTVWVCSACETCTTRCPNGVRIAELMDGLKEMALRENVPCPQPQILALHQAFLNNIKNRGRVAESAFLTTYLIRSGQLMQRIKTRTWQEEARLGWELFKKGRSPIFSHRTKDRAAIRRMLTPTGKKGEQP